ncbi:MAG: HPF/RaiA family ribosome-associated protein [Phycisphaerales bacterium]|nr:HPF/RaiA family ribosome-associated protein [Phycisphaerae bacterium]NNF44106.1 HPF/RaiA family ribosome-associated protein [Phycisphaerales bacterium]NNM24764.1 HPF/RaiA family ribosome-associated protein [Phycisphaerales bacterium]
MRGGEGRQSRWSPDSHQGACVTHSEVPVQVTFRGMAVSDALEAACWEEAEKLTRFDDRLQRCRVTIIAPPRHHTKGQPYNVTIDLHVPGAELVVNRVHRDDPKHADPFIALRDAFSAARRQLDDQTRRRRGEEKTHEPPAYGRVRELQRAEGWGRIETPDARELYFHRNSVVGDFDVIELGNEVRFVEEQGLKGPQASSVTPVGRHNRRTG